MPAMKRLQIYIEERMDETLALLAVQERTSKAALIRKFVAERLGIPETTGDPLDELIGRYAMDSGDIDEVIYGQGR